MKQDSLNSLDGLSTATQQMRVLQNPNFWLSSIMSFARRSMPLSVSVKFSMRLKQVIANLITNAIIFSREGGVINIDMQRGDARMIIPASRVRWPQKKAKASHKVAA